MVIGRGGSPSGEIIAKAMDIKVVDMPSEGSDVPVILWGNSVTGMSPEDMDKRNLVCNTAVAAENLKNMTMADRISNGIIGVTPAKLGSKKLVENLGKFIEAAANIVMIRPDNGYNHMHSYSEALVENSKSAVANEMSAASYILAQSEASRIDGDIKMVGRMHVAFNKFMLIGDDSVHEMGSGDSWAMVAKIALLSKPMPIPFRCKSAVRQLMANLNIKVAALDVICTTDSCYILNITVCPAVKSTTVNKFYAGALGVKLMKKKATATPKAAKRKVVKALTFKEQLKSLATNVSDDEAAHIMRALMSVAKKG